jgi:hypothetical protein
MKKVLFLIAAACMLAPATVFAQETKVTRTEDDKTITVIEETPVADGKIVTTTVLEKNSVFTNGFWHNWELSAGIGPHLYYGDNDWKVAKWTEMVTFPAIDLYLTKWASPSFGVGLGVTGAKFVGLYQTTPGKSTTPRTTNANFQTTDKYTDADAKYNSQNLARQRGSFINVYALAHANLMNIFEGYKPDRFFEIDAFAGGGILYGLTKGSNVPGASFNCGLTNKFRITDQFRLMINVRGALIGDDFDGEAYIDEPDKTHWLANHKLDGNFGITAGFSYYLGKEYSKWRLAERTSTMQYNKEIVKELVTEIKEVPKVEYITEVPEVWFHINFVIDRWDISKKELINIHAVSDLIKSTPNTKYLICGYADKQTATPPHNLMLSENRAKAVYNVMVNEFGVNPDQLVMDYKGGVDYMFYNMKELSRCTMITSIKE